jgi:membrane fusion protein, multidrug efflux system
MDPSTPSALETLPPSAPKTDVKLPPAPPEPPKRSRAGWVWLAILVVAAAAVYFFWPQIKAMIPAAPTAPATGGRGRGGGGTTPVVATRAKKGDIQIYDNGLGAVTPIYTVTVKSRVDGELMEVKFKEGQLVHKGDTLVEIDPRPYEAALEQAQGNLLRDQALLANAKIDLERYKTLLKQEAVPEQQYATQVALVSQDEGQVKTDQGSINAAAVNVTYCHIKSDIDGVVGLRLVDPGNIVHATDTNGMLVITQVDPISVIFTLPEDQLPPVLDKLHAGQHLPVQAWDRANVNKLADGELQTVDNQIDPTTGTLRLRAVFSNPNFKLFPSQFVNVRLLVDTHRSVTLVQNAAVQRSSQNTYVWLVNPETSTVNIRTVTLGVTEGDSTEILSGLEPGDEAVMVGVDKLQDNSKVNAQVQGEAPSNAPAQKSGARGKSGKKKS